jgi:hypothetical protein
MKMRQVEQKIRDAFPSHKYPGDWNIVYDNTSHHLECEDIRKAFQGKLWDTIDAEFLLSWHQSDLTFMSPRGFRYYLPAYLITALDYEGADMIPFNVMSSLTFWEDDNERMREHKKERIALLSDRQHQAVLAFLEFMRDEYPDEWMDDEPSRAISTIETIMEEQGRPY